MARFASRACEPFAKAAPLACCDRSRSAARRDEATRPHLRALWRTGLVWTELPLAPLGRGAKEGIHAPKQLVGHALVLALEPELETVHLARSRGLVDHTRAADLCI